MPDGILFLLRLEFVSKEIDFTSMSSEGGMKESQHRGLKSDLRCHLSQMAQHRSHSLMSMAWRLVLRDRFELPEIFLGCSPVPVCFPYCTIDSVRKSSEVSVCDRSVETIRFFLVTQALHLGKRFPFCSCNALGCCRKC